jgi:hypothetical protein
MDRFEIRQQRFLSIPHPEWSGLTGGERATLFVVAAIGLGGLLVLLIWSWILLFR